MEFPTVGVALLVFYYICLQISVVYIGSYCQQVVS